MNLLLRQPLAAKQYAKLIDLFGKFGAARSALRDWRDRTRLPLTLPKSVRDAIAADRDSDLVLVYLNNTIYGQFTDGAQTDFPKWTVRGTWLKVALYNGDYFDHGYQNMDFGGARGWENQFKSSVRLGGSGVWHTFGRVHWWRNIPPAVVLLRNALPGVVTVAAAKRAPSEFDEDQFGFHRVHILYNYEPSRRLRFYQYDPVHPEVAVFAVH